MDFLKKYKLEGAKLYKVIGLLILGLVLAVFALSMLASTFGGVLRGLPHMTSISEPSYDAAMPPFAGKGGGVAGYASSNSYAGDRAELSIRNIDPIAPGYGQTTGSTAEQYEVSDYSASIETRNRDEACAHIASLKELEYVVFENASDSKKACSFTFKVERAHLAEILERLRGMSPKELSENTYTIKNQIDDFTGQEDILKKKLESIDSTLETALEAYDEITRIATRANDAASLATIINSKVQIIERLTQERINVRTELDTLARARAEQLGRIDYAYFNVYVYENKYIDPEEIAESWKSSLRAFFTAANQALQDATLNLIVFLLTLLPYAIYLALLLLAAKYGWQFAKFIWNK